MNDSKNDFRIQGKDNMKTFVVAAIGFACIAISVVAGSPLLAEERRPNILFILADDKY